MKKIFILLMMCFLFCGCITLRDVGVSDDIQKQVERIGPPETIAVSEMPVTLGGAPVGIQNTEQKAPVEETARERGVIFAKTDFQGLLKARYVKFFFEDQEDPAHKFQLHIGESSDQLTFPWEVKTVKQGYFFVDLPAGRYKISSISIPVGSTVATEEANITVEVFPDEICYVGTLKMVGTKERIKLGGLPVIKPGFEYTVEVLDEYEDGLEAFRKKYPNSTQEIPVKLMHVNPLSPEK